MIQALNMSTKFISGFLALYLFRKHEIGIKFQNNAIVDSVPKWYLIAFILSEISKFLGSLVRFDNRIKRQRQIDLETDREITERHADKKMNRLIDGLMDSNLVC